MALLIACLVATFFLLLALYLAPIIGRNQIPPIAAQVLGCAAVLGVYSVWAASHPANVAWYHVLWFFVAGGAPSVVGEGLYWLEAWLNRQSANKALVEGQDDEQPGRPHG
jgi:hypothetical protein